MSPERRSGGLNAFCRFVYMCSIIPGKSKPLLSLTSTVAIRESFGTIVCNYPSINTVFASGCKKDENVAWFFFFFFASTFSSQLVAFIWKSYYDKSSFFSLEARRAFLLSF